MAALRSVCKQKLIDLFKNYFFTVLTIFIFIFFKNNHNFLIDYFFKLVAQKYCTSLKMTILLLKNQNSFSSSYRFFL